MLRCFGLRDSLAQCPLRLLKGPLLSLHVVEIQLDGRDFFLGSFHFMRQLGELSFQQGLCRHELLTLVPEALFLFEALPPLRFGLFPLTLQPRGILFEGAEGFVRAFPALLAPETQ